MLYGGVSLAIYIYGVVYEVWRLVRASRRTRRTPRQLLRDADAWATVDITSGASAGGINGVLLPRRWRAADLGAVRSLWVDGGDFASFCAGREEESAVDLSSDRFEELLADGLKAMDPEARAPPLVTVFDLFAPGPGCGRTSGCRSTSSASRSRCASTERSSTSRCRKRG